MTQQFRVKPGWIILDASQIRGTETLVRTAQTFEEDLDHRVERTWETTKIVDHKVWVAQLKACRKKADNILRSKATTTPFGYWADTETKDAIVAAFETLADETAEIQANARPYTRCVCHISCVAVRIDLASPDVARELARTCRESLNDLRAALVDGNLSTSQNIWYQQVRGLKGMATGFQGQCLDMALEVIPGLLTDLRKGLKDGTSPQTVGRMLDLTDLDGAMAQFEELGV
jgi:hypothetical protein